MCHIVQLLDIRHNILTLLPYEAEQTPHNNRRVVKILIYNIFQLLHAAILKLWRRVITYICEGYRRAGKWHIHPRQHTPLIAPIIQLRAMWAIKRTERISTHITHKCEVLLEVRHINRHTLSRTVVGIVYTPHLTLLAIDT